MARSTRLTTWMRDSILTALLKHAFEAREKALKERKFDLADKVYDHLYSAEVKEQMEALPAGWLPGLNSIKVRFSEHRNNSYTHLHFRDSEHHRRMGYNHYQYASTFPAGTELDDENEAITREEEALRAEKDTARASALAALKSVTTVNRLIEVWPEIETFAKKYVNYGNDSACRAVALPLATLNKALGLPPQ